MIQAAILTAIIAALIFFCKRHRRKKEQETRYYTPEALQSAIKQNERRKQAESDFHFYCNRVNDLEIMLWEATTAEQTARAKLEHIDSMNQSGAVISDKATDKARRDLYQQQRRRLSLENQLHAAERAKAKAFNTLTE